MDGTKKVGMGKKIGLGCGGAVVLFIVIGLIGSKVGGSSSSSNSVTPAAATPAAATPARLVAISAIQLNQEYKRNEVAADEAWKGKSVEVSGKVSRIDKDFTDSIHVRLAVSEFGLDDVDCKMPDSLKAKVAKLKKGDAVRIRGKVTGMVLGTVGIEAEP
jgi:hypothetical protein